MSGQFLWFCLFSILLLLCHQADCKNVFQMSVDGDHVARGTWRSRPTAGTKCQLAKHFQNNMVLQRGPSRASIYGFSDGIGDKIIVEMKPLSGSTSTRDYYYTTHVQTGPGPLGGVWNVTLDPMEPNVVVKIMVISPSNILTISNVIFGDVWLCSGQSNMQFPVAHMFNFTEEYALADKFPNVRIMAVALSQSKTPLSDVIGLRENWSPPSEESLMPFSAVCWLFGRMVNEVTNIPMGMISTEWGGTPVEAWSSPDALKKCGVTENVEIDISETYDPYQVDPPHNNSVLWNAMIHPFTQMTTYGALWYQGEANAKIPSMNIYNCTFPAMIADWRAKFNAASGGLTNSTFPFGFVQLAPDQDAPTLDIGFPDIRWHQTADVGYVPNPKMPNVFMAVAYDLPDFKSPFGSVHPRDKLDVGKRLTYSGLSVAYNLTRPFQGPFPQTVSLVGANFTIDYGSQWTLEIRDAHGFELLCSKSGSPSIWEPTPLIGNGTSTVTIYFNVCNTGFKPTGLRYNWRVSPCAFKKCAVYSVANELPAPPFVAELSYEEDSRIVPMTKIDEPLKAV